MDRFDETGPAVGELARASARVSDGFARLSEPRLGSYFVSAYPPFSCWTAGALTGFEDRLTVPSGGEPLGLYVHVPFCVERCDYCYYLCYDDRFAETDRYVNALIAETARYAALPAVRDRPIDFVYFGGGTPSTLTAGQLSRLLGGLTESLPWTEVREVTFECSPKTVTREKLEALREGGVTRLSIGAQQLDDRVLELNGRVHLTADFESAWSEAREVGFDVINVDLIAGLVGESDDTFFPSLERLLEMEPDSVTIYLLEVPHNTALSRAARSPGASVAGPALPSWAEKRGRLERAFARLEEVGFVIRSAYCAVRDPESHAFRYQDEQYRGADVLGLGVSSFSYLDGWHQQNAADLQAYLALVEAERLPLARAYHLEDEERSVREFVLQLKLGGVDLDGFLGKFGPDACDRFSEPLEELEKLGWLIRTPKEIRLTRQGLLRVDRLLEGFYLPRHVDTGLR